MKGECGECGVRGEWSGGSGECGEGGRCLATPSTPLPRSSSRNPPAVAAEGVAEVARRLLDPAAREKRLLVAEVTALPRFRSRRGEEPRKVTALEKRLVGMARLTRGLPGAVGLLPGTLRVAGSDSARRIGLGVAEGGAIRASGRALCGVLIAARCCENVPVNVATRKAIQRRFTIYMRLLTCARCVRAPQ